MFSNWIYTSDLVNLTYEVGADSWLLSSYVESGEWHVEDFRITRHDTHYTNDPLPFPEVTFQWHLRRFVHPLFRWGHLLTTFSHFDLLDIIVRSANVLGVGSFHCNRYSNHSCLGQYLRNQWNHIMSRPAL